MKNGVMWPILLILFVLSAFLAGGCGESNFEKGKRLFDQGFYEQAMPYLEKSDEGEHFIQTKEMIRQSKEKIEEAADADCLRHAEDYMEMLLQAKTVGTWDKVIQELKAYRCRKLNVKPYVDKAYYKYIAYLAEWDAYPKAVEKYCEYTGCETQPPHLLIREEEISITDDKGKEKQETIQQEIPIAKHEIVMEMFLWLVKKEAKNARWLDRYAKFLYDNTRYKNALDAYNTLAALEGIGYEVKSRAKLTADHLSKGGRRKSVEGEDYRFFWVEDVKTKSKIKALLKDLEKARKEKEEAERRKEATATPK